jgi:hypothetical protein
MPCDTLLSIHPGSRDGIEVRAIGFFTGRDRPEHFTKIKQFQAKIYKHAVEK